MQLRHLWEPVVHGDVRATGKARKQCVYTGTLPLHTKLSQFRAYWLCFRILSYKGSHSST